MLVKAPRKAMSRRAMLRLAGAAGLGALAWPRRSLLAASAANGNSGPLFEEVPPSASGITWVHTNAMSPERYLPETMGPGVAFLDYDNDGWMDIYMVNSGPCDFYTPPRPLKNALYRNNRDGTFTDVTDKAGVAAPGWTTSAVWFDYDNDGRLDLFLCSFVEFGIGKHVFCGDNKLGRRYYCIPRIFKPTPSRLFHNNGDGTFTETDAGTDIQRSLGKALGVVATDINNDGRLDLFVANDTVQNFLFANRGGGKWEEIGLPSEVGFSANGQARSGMGVDSADFDQDGWQDLFVANVDQEMYSLYRNNRDESFADVAHTNDVAQATRLMSGWGLKFFDVDNDGHLDLFLANGHPDDQIDQYAGQVRYREPLLLFKNDGTRLHDVSKDAGPVFQKPFPARGLAVGDFDNDGRLDVLIGNNGEAPALLKNKAGPENHWVGLRLVGTKCNRDAVGARLRWSVGGVERSRLKTAGGSYLSSHDPREILGLGAATKLDWLEIQWPAPSGRAERFTDIPVDRYLTVIEGKGIA